MFFLHADFILSWCQAGKRPFLSQVLHVGPGQRRAASHTTQCKRWKNCSSVCVLCSRSSSEGLMSLCKVERAATQFSIQFIPLPYGTCAWCCPCGLEIHTQFGRQERATYCSFLRVLWGWTPGWMHGWSFVPECKLVVLSTQPYMSTSEWCLCSQVVWQGQGQCD